MQIETDAISSRQLARDVAARDRLTLWFVLSAQWMTVVPDHRTGSDCIIVGGDGSAKEWISGTILAAEVVVALVVAPISGALLGSVATSARRRRLFLIGEPGSSIGLLLLFPFGPGASLATRGGVHLLQLRWNGWRYYAGLIPTSGRTRTGSRKRLAGFEFARQHVTDGWRVFKPPAATQRLRNV
jgi:hypothetical protein